MNHSEVRDSRPRHPSLAAQTDSALTLSPPGVPCYCTAYSYSISATWSDHERHIKALLSHWKGVFFKSPLTSLRRNHKLGLSGSSHVFCYGGMVFPVNHEFYCNTTSEKQGAETTARSFQCQGSGVCGHGDHRDQDSSMYNSALWASVLFVWYKCAVSTYTLTLFLSLSLLLSLSLSLMCVRPTSWWDSGSGCHGEAASLWSINTYVIGFLCCKGHWGSNLAPWRTPPAWWRDTS